MSTLPLTAAQEKLWRFIQSCERSPSFREMSLHMYGKDTGIGAIHVLVNELERRGFVERDTRRSRSVVAIDGRNTDLERVKTSELMAELERRGLLMGCAA